MTDLDMARAVHDLAHEVNSVLPRKRVKDKSESLRALLGLRYDNLAAEASGTLSETTHAGLVANYSQSISEYYRDKGAPVPDCELLVQLQRVRLDIASELILAHFSDKERRNPHLHMLESLCSIIIVGSGHSDEGYEQEDAKDRIKAAYREVSEIAEFLAVDPPANPTSVTDFTSFQKAWQCLCEYVGTLLEQQIPSWDTSYGPLFGPRAPQDVDSDFKQWTFRELVAVCDSHQRPDSLKDAHEAYQQLALALSAEMGRMRTGSDLGHLLFRGFRIHCVKPAFWKLKKEIRLDSGRLGISPSDLKDVLDPLIKAIDTLLTLSAGPHLSHRDLSVSKLQTHSAGTLKSSDVESLQRVRNHENNLTTMRNFYTLTLIPALGAFHDYSLHAQGAEAGVYRSASQICQGGEWEKLKASEQAILKVLNSQNTRLKAKGVADRTLNFGTSFTLGTLARHFVPLRKKGYIQMDLRGYLIAPAGRAIIPKNA